MALGFDVASARVVYENIGNFNSGAKSILLDFFLPSNALQANNDFFSATRNPGNDTFQNFLLQLSDEGGTHNSVRSAHFGGSTGQAYTSSNVLSVGEWNRVVWTCSNCEAPSTLNTKIYVNAVSQSIFGGSTGASLGATNGDVCIGNRAHLDRGINGQIARFAIVNRVVSEAEIALFELGVKPSEIFSDLDLLLKPNTYYLDNWGSNIGGVSKSATLTNVSQVQDPTYGITSAQTELSVSSQYVSASNSVSQTSNSLVGNAALPYPTPSLSVAVAAVSNSILVVGEFDGGTVDAIATSIESEPVDTVVNFVPRKFAYRDSSHDWLTLQARVDNVNSVSSLKFKLSDVDFDLGQSFTAETKLWWRPVNGTKEDWVTFENHSLSGGVVTASNSSAFGVASIYVGDQPGYFYSDIVSDVSNWLASPFITAPSGASADGSISELTSISDENGRFSGPLKQHAIRIGSAEPPSFPELSNKIRVLAFANIHSGEMVSKWATKGFIDWLIGTSVKASSVRKNFEVFVVWVNATGLFLGHPVSPEFVGLNGNKNLNRDWGEFELEASRTVRDWVSINLGNDFDFLVDFHNLTWGATDKIFRDPNPLSVAFSDNVDANYNGSIVQQGNTAPSGFTTHYYRNNYGIYGATLEPRRGSNDLSNYQHFGAAAGEAFHDMLIGGAFGRFSTIRSSSDLPICNVSATNLLSPKSHVIATLLM